MSEPPADNGLQQERTTLAWRRTGLALFVAAVVIGRLTVQSAGHVTLLLFAFGAVIALWAVASTLRRGRWSGSPEPDSAFDSLLRDGRLPAALAVVAGLLCLVELTVILGIAR
ncbi:MAG: DUF202 domain-containing protein [Pseudonocardiaceae bacterium]